MLVLTRAIDESIVINGNIVVTIVDVRGDKVRLGVDAPLDVPVHRREVYEAIATWEAAEAPGDGHATAAPAPQSVDLPQPQADLVDRIVREMAERGQNNVTRSDVVQSILAGVEHLADELCRASSPQEIQQLLRASMRGAEKA